MSLTNTTLTLHSSSFHSSSSSSSHSRSLRFLETHSRSLPLLGRIKTPRLAVTRLRSTLPLRMDASAMTESDSSSNCAEIWVIRHGETEWNASGKIQGHLDIELNDSGRQQAVAVAERLSKETKFSFIYSSDLKRASETAEIIAAKCGIEEVIKDPSLRERHLGNLQGFTRAYIAQTDPETYNAFMSPKKDLEIPGGGESRDQIYQRATSALKRIGRKHLGQRIVLVSHGGFIRALHGWACPNQKPAGKIVNTSVNVFRFSNQNKWTLDVWDDVSHLDQTGYLKSGFGGDKNSG